MVIAGWNLRVGNRWHSRDNKVIYWHDGVCWKANAFGSMDDRQLLIDAGLQSTASGMSLRQLSAVVSEIIGCSPQLQRAGGASYYILGMNLVVTRVRRHWELRETIEDGLGSLSTHGQIVAAVRGVRYQSRQAALAALTEVCATHGIAPSDTQYSL